MLRMVTSPPACRPRDQRHHHSQHLPTRPDLCHTFINGNEMGQCEWSLFLAVKDAGRKGIFATFSLHILTIRKVHCLFQPNWVSWSLIMYIHIIWFYIFFYVYIYFEIIYFSILTGTSQTLYVGFIKYLVWVSSLVSFLWGISWLNLCIGSLTTDRISDYSLWCLLDRVQF